LPVIAGCPVTPALPVSPCVRVWKHQTASTSATHSLDIRTKRCGVPPTLRFAAEASLSADDMCAARWRGTDGEILREEWYGR
jgi:hypothetical protein